MNRGNVGIVDQISGYPFEADPALDPVFTYTMGHLVGHGGVGTGDGQFRYQMRVW